jgi:hypothetical protein
VLCSLTHQTKTQLSGTRYVSHNSPENLTEKQKDTRQLFGERAFENGYDCVVGAATMGRSNASLRTS